VMQSSGSAALDSASCRILRSRARFTPARAGDGHPTAGEVVHTRIWTLPS
jgi:protein TonB